jgi:hypothetical protein
VAGQIRSVSSTPLIISMSTNASNDAVVSASWTDGSSMQMRYNANDALGFIDNTYPITPGQVWGDIRFRQNNGGTMDTRMFIQARTGNVGIGIGTNSPEQRLHVGGFVRTNGISIHDGTTVSAFIGYEKNWIGSGTSNRLAIAAESDAVNIYTSGSAVERVRFTNNYIWTNPNNVAFNMYLQLNRQSSADGGIILQTNNANDWQIVNAGTDLWFYSYGIGTTAFRVMRNTGNFLINTTTDVGYKLDVVGTGRFTAIGNGDGILIESVAGERAPALKLYPKSSSANERNWAISPYKDIQQSLSISSSNVKGGDPYSNGTTRLLIDGISGNVLIGTTTSTGAKLEINGDIRTGVLDTGYVSGFWKLGRAVIGTQPSETHQIIVEINGQLYVIGAAAL